MGLKGLIIATVLVFSLAVYMLAASPAVSHLYDDLRGGAVKDQGYQNNMDFVRDTALVFVPTLFVIGIILYAYAAIQKEESFFGSRPR